MPDRLRRFFAERGLAYNSNPKVVLSSRAALRLAELARECGLHRTFHDRVMAAYWAEGQDIGDGEVLRLLAAEVGLPGDAVEETLTGERYLDVVEASTRQAVSIGVTCVPAFVLDRRLVVPGAQPNQAFEGAFERLAAAAGPEERT